MPMFERNVKGTARRRLSHRSMKKSSSRQSSCRGLCVESGGLGKQNIDCQRQVIASRGPVLALNDFDADQVRGPDRRHEAEVDVPGLGRIALMTIGRVCLVTVLDAVKRVIGADQ